MASYLAYVLNTHPSTLNMEDIAKPYNDLPPGTVRIKDVENSRTIFVPHPSPDPNQPLVSKITRWPSGYAVPTTIELEHATEGVANEHSLRLHHF